VKKEKKEEQKEMKLFKYVEKDDVKVKNEYFKIF